MNLKNKVALITGGTKGIGLEIARSLMKEGMQVAITGTRESSVDQGLKDLGDEAVGYVCDVRDLQAQQEVVKNLREKYGSIDVLIANAGVGHFAPIQDLTPAQWSEVVDVNLTGVFNSVKASLDALRDSKGYLITIASLAGANFFASGAAYNASKFGLVGFTQAVMLDLRYDGVKVSTIMPGSVATHFNNRTPTEADAWKIQPEDIGQIVVDLLKMPARTLPSKVEVRPSIPRKK